MQEKLVKIGDKVVNHISCAALQMAEVLVSKSLHHQNPAKINRLKPVSIGSG